MAPQGNRSHELESPLLKRYLAEISQFPILSIEEEREVGRCARKGDPEALRRLIESNLRFVVAFSKKFRGWGLSFQDLINEGNLGLIEAAKRFDPERGTRFITYAVWWIRQAIIHALSEQGGAFRIPQKQANLLYNIHKTITAMTPMLERSPTTSEVAAELDVPREQVETLMRAQSEDIPLESGLDDETDFSLLDKLEQSSMPPLDERLVEESYRKLLSSMLKHLEEKERRVVTLRYGLAGQEPMTLKQVGDLIGLSRERVRQIETQALKKLKHHTRGKQIHWYLN